MLLVYALKNTLSIEEIKRVLTGVREECGFTGEDMIRAYHHFLSLKEGNRTRAAQTVHGILQEDKLSTERDYDFFLSLLDIFSLSAYLKEIGREMLEARYKDLAVREQEIRAREEQERREREEEEGVKKREKKAKKVQAKAERKLAKIDPVPADTAGNGEE
jgi:hypothetical protein